MAGIVVIRKGDRLQVFVQAAIAVFVVNAMVVTVFSLLGARDVRGILELWFASAASALGSGVAAVGTFAVLGSVFGILTVFQLLELANPSQPLLRRLLVETPGTYHHSLMVGNLAERAAEAIGGDPLVTRVAAYYHDIGKLANPLAFIENQAGGENVHDDARPRGQRRRSSSSTSSDGIDLAYKSKLPKALIAFIPQHHGTAIMSYFYARARERAAEPFGGLSTAGGRQAADAVDERQFRHAGPKPQSREAAIIMLADSVEASVRSLESRDEPAIRAMVTRIIEERLEDGQFDECDLTLRDLERIREAFVAQLLGMYHTRIAYPQSKIVELESRGETGSSSSRPGASTSRRGGSTSRPVTAWRSRSPAARAGAGGRGGAGRGRGARAGLDRPDPDRRRRAGRPQCDPHGRARPDGRAVVSAAAADGVPAASGRAGRGADPGARHVRFALPPGRRVHLGDIVVSVERAAEQAAAGRGGQTGDVRWSTGDELRLLVTHGMLHVCGWDHADPVEGDAMRALEQRLLAGG